MKAKECLAKIERDFTRKVCDTYKEGNFEDIGLIRDISHRYEKIISLLEQTPIMQ